MRIKKISILALGLLCMTMNIPWKTFAKESLMVPANETKQQGSIAIQLEDTEEHLSKENVAFSIVKVADVENGEFILNMDFASCNIDFEKIENANEIEEAAKKIVNKVTKADQIIYTDEKGFACINLLSVGVYLVYVQNSAGYETILPTLVSIPSWDEGEEKMNYDIEMIPKHVSTKETAIPETGDQSQMEVYLTILAATILVIAGWGRRKPKKDEGLQKK